MKSKNKIKVDVPTTNEESNRLRAIFKKTSGIINLMGTILALFFGWLQFSGLPIVPMFDDKFSNIFYKIVVAIYYFAWIFGTSIDLEDEEYSMIVAPNKGKLTISAIGMLVLMGIVFGLLCWADTPVKFTIFLDIFFVVNFISWLFLLRYVKPSINESRKRYESVNSFIGNYQIDIIEKYLFGNWQWRRFAFGFLTLLFLNFLSFTNLAGLIATVFKVPSSQFIIVLTIFLFVCVMEIWIWIIRLKRKLTLQIITEIDEKCELIPQEKIGQEITND